MVTPGEAGDGVPDWFLVELDEAFRRHRPQHTLRWNYDAAFGQLHQVVPSEAPPPSPLHVEAPAGPAESGIPAGPAALLRRPTWRRPGRRDEQAPAGRPAGATGGDAGGMEEGLAATLEAFRFLAARVQRLEEATARRHRPVEGLEWLCPPPPAGWFPAAAALVAGRRAEGVVVHAEAGAGGLLDELASAGVAAEGVEPRGAVAAAAAAGGRRVHLGGALEHLGGRPPGSLGALVLTGVVDRLALEDLCELLAVATDRLAPGAPLVVVSGDPAATGSGWTAVARDLLPGRPLHAETWQLLFARAGYDDVAVLGAPVAGLVGAAVAGWRAA